jgi:hypothetical protein
MNNTIYTNTDNLVIARGKVFHNNTISLPKEWEKTVNPKTITVSITPCGMYHKIFVKYVNIKEIKLDSDAKVPIECYYQVTAELNNQ